MTLRLKLASLLTSLAIGSTALVGCSVDTTSSASTTATSTAVAVAADQGVDEALAENTAVHTTADSTGDVVDVTLTGDSATSSGDGVTVDGGTVDGGTVTITAAGTYRLSGELAGQVVVDAPDATVRLVLDGATITSTTTAAIAATEAELLVVELAAGSTSTLGDTASYAEEADVNAALFSAGDLTVTGTGALRVTGNGNDAIASKDGLVVESGAVTVAAADDGVRGQDYVVLQGGTLDVAAGGDGVKADSEDADAGYVSVTGGTLTVEAQGDGVDAASDVLVSGGTVDVTSGGGSGVAATDDPSVKGLKSGVLTVLEGGTLTVDAADDALHSDGSTHLAGATVSVSAGDDGVHAEDALLVSGGTVAVTRSVEGLEAKDITVADGEVGVVSSDDGVNATEGTSSTADGGGPGGGETVADATVTVTGGTLTISSEGDGLDSNGNASITGGTVVVNGPEQPGNGALDVNGTLDVSGGTLTALGSAGMVVTPDADSAQGFVAVTLDAAVPAGTTLELLDDDGAVVATVTTAKTTQTVVLSAADVTDGATYTVSSGGTDLGTGTAGEEATGGMGGGGRGPR